MRILGAALLPLILLAPSLSQAQTPAAAPAAAPAAPAKDAKDAAGKGAKPAPPPKGPVGKAAAPCGATILPLVQGNSWTYSFTQSPNPPREDLQKLLPTQPATVTITVKTVETKGPDTVITLEEKTSADLSKDPKKHIMDERTYTSTVTCNRTRFEISPNSFFFAGEPGGYFGLTFDDLKRPKDSSLKLAGGTIGDAKWRDDIVAHFVRNPTEGTGAKLDSGKLELEREFTPAQPERINTRVGWYTAERLVLSTTGRVTLDHAAAGTEPMQYPANWVNQIWMVPNVGVAQVLNAYGHMYILSDAQLK